MPFVAVVPEESAPSVIAVPSTTRFSFAPSASPPIVKVRPMIVCPASTVPALAPENTATAAPCVPTPAASVKVEPAEFAASVGGSLTPVTLTVLVAMLLSEIPSLTVKLIVRLAVFGVSEVSSKVTACSAAAHCARVAVAPDEVSVRMPVPAA